MKKGRSVYTFQLNCDPNLINNLIQSYIQSNQYKLQQEKGEQFYRAGDGIQGYKYFNYSIDRQYLTISAWFKGAFSEVPIEQNSLNVAAMSYRNSLNTLFQEINKLNNGGINMNFDPKTGQPLNNSQQFGENNVNQFTQTFLNETTKKQEKMCEIGFWLSLFGLFCSLFGVMYGILVYILNFYFAIQGLKTRKKGKAIATILLTVASTLIIVFQLIAG
ncbi:MAG: hypothetical protein IJA94_02220 [Bacilli bacterium]|nr:hypothetical protein [Bacilli bacterium]